MDKCILENYELFEIFELCYCGRNIIVNKNEFHLPYTCECGVEYTVCNHCRLNELVCECVFCEVCGEKLAEECDC